MILDSSIRVDLDGHTYHVRWRGDAVSVYCAVPGLYHKRGCHSKLWSGTPCTNMPDLAARVLAQIKTEVLKW